MSYDWNFSVFFAYWPAFLSGLKVTLELAILSSVFGTFLGFLFAYFLQLSVIGKILRLVNDMLRAVPMLVLMFFFYYFPYTSFGIDAPSAFVAALCALTLSQLNFTAEIVRAAVVGLNTEVEDGARALGFKESTIWLRIKLPNIFKQIIPTLFAFFIGNVKLSSLASVIGTEEVVYVAQSAVGQTFRSLEAWVLVGLLYIVIVLPMTFLSSQIENSDWIKRRI